MALWEPLTDTAKMLREMIGFVEDVIRVAGKAQVKLKEIQRKNIARILADLYFEPAGMPAYLGEVIASGGSNTPQRLRALDNIYGRLGSTDDVAERGLRKLGEVQTFLQFEMGLEYSSGFFRDEKTMLRRQLLRLEGLDGEVQVREAQFILESIEEFNASLARLHDLLLKLPQEREPEPSDGGPKPKERARPLSVRPRKPRQQP